MTRALASLLGGAALLLPIACSDSHPFSAPIQNAPVAEEAGAPSAASVEPAVVVPADNTVPAKSVPVSSVPVRTVPASPVTVTPAAVPAPTGEEAFNSECGACHKAFPPQFLPARSWQTIMAGLSSHFGENASLDPDTERQISDYLVANAAVTGSPVFRGLDANAAPLRITETPFWIRIHHELRPSVFDRPDVKSKSNCVACHGAGRSNHEHDG